MLLKVRLRHPRGLGLTVRKQLDTAETRSTTDPCRQIHAETCKIFGTIGKDVVLDSQIGIG